MPSHCGVVNMYEGVWYTDGTNGNDNIYEPWRDQSLPGQPQWIPQQWQPQPVQEPFDITDWTPDFPTVWDDSMCIDMRHRLYRAIGLPCPCREKFEKELPQKWSEWFAKRMQKQANKNPAPAPALPTWPQQPAQPWTPQPWQPWTTGGGTWASDNTDRYQIWSCNNVTIQS